MPTRALDSSRFSRWDEDSLRGRIQTHPGNGLGRRRHDRPPRTNSPIRGSRTGSGLRIRWAGVRIPPGAPLFPVGFPRPILAEASNASFFRVASPATADVSDAQSVGQDCQMLAPTKLINLRCPRPGSGSIGPALVLCDSSRHRRQPPPPAGRLIAIMCGEWRRRVHPREGRSDLPVCRPTTPVCLQLRLA
jgi:hypothetical protein